MQLTIDILKKHSACTSGTKFFIASGLTTVESVVDKLLSSSDDEILNFSDNTMNKYAWSNWILSRMFNRSNKIKYAVFAAEQVLSVFEKKYPEDKRPHKAIEAAKTYLNNQSEENRRAAYAAAAYAAAAAAAAAADAYAAAAAAAAAAAYAADDAAAAAAAYAADDAAAAYAADDAAAADAAAAADDAAAAAAAYAADDADVKKEMYEKIIRYGLTLLEDNN